MAGAETKFDGDGRPQRVGPIAGLGQGKIPAGLVTPTPTAPLGTGPTLGGCGEFAGTLSTWGGGAPCLDK